MAEVRRGSAGTAGEGLDLELHLGLPSTRIAFDLDLNVDLSLFAGPIPVENLALAVYEGPVAMGVDDVPAPVPPAVTEGVAVVDVEMRALVVYVGPAAGDDVPVPPEVTDNAAVADVDMAAVVVYERPAAGDGAVTKDGVLATLDDDLVEAGQIVPAGSADSTAQTEPLCHPPLQQVPPDVENEIQLRPWPWAGSGARQSRRKADMVRAWVRDQLQKKHRLPRDLPLSYIGEKVLSKSDMTPRHARLLLPARARARLRTFLHPAEIVACGFDSTDPKPIRIPGVRATPTTYPGVPLSVYVSSGRGRGQCKSDSLKLNVFHRNDATVINGEGYRSFMVDCGLEAGDGVEVWAFRWPPGIRPCLLIAKKDGVRPRARNP